MHIKIKSGALPALEDLYNALPKVDDVISFNTLLKEWNIDKIDLFFFDKLRKANNKKTFFEIAIGSKYELTKEAIINGIYNKGDSFLIIDSDLNIKEKIDLLKAIYNNNPDEKKEIFFNNKIYLQEADLSQHENILFYLFNNKKIINQYYNLMQFLIDEGIEFKNMDGRPTARLTHRNILHKIISTIGRDNYENHIIYDCIELAIKSGIGTEYKKWANTIDLLFDLQLPEQAIIRIIKIFKNNGLSTDGHNFSLYQYATIYGKFNEELSKCNMYLLSDESPGIIKKYIKEIENLDMNGNKAVSNELKKIYEIKITEKNIVGELKGKNNIINTKKI